MSNALRIELLAAAVLFIVLVITTINRKKLLMKYSLIWLLASLCMLLIAIFPQIAEGITTLVGIQTTSNFVYLMAIIFLLALTFSLTVIVSVQANKIKKLVQTLSIEKYLEREESSKGSKE